MLTIPWFVTKTIQDLCRRTPLPPPLRQEQQQQFQQQQSTQKQQQQPNSQSEFLKSNVARVQDADPVTTKAPGASTDFIRAEAVTPHYTSPATRPEGISASSQLPVKTSTTSPSSIVEPSVQTSSRTLVLQQSASGGRMSFEWAQKQIEKFQFDFDKADTDKSGTLSFDEVYNVLLNVGFKGSKEEAQFIFGHLDRDKDQKVTREEFTTALKNLPRLSIKEFVLRQTFKKLDKDGSGYLSRSEIADATKSEGGVDIAANKISDLLIYLAKDDDEKVSYEEFLHVLGVEDAATVMKQVFSRLDTDGSGFLTKEEILDAVKAESELKLKADKIADLLIYWVKDADKKISYQEFVDVWLKQREVKPKK